MRNPVHDKGDPCPGRLRVEPPRFGWVGSTNLLMLFWQAEHEFRRFARSNSRFPYFPPPLFNLRPEVEDRDRELIDGPMKPFHLDS